MEAVMAGELYPVAGQKLFIGGVISVGLADLVVADFSGQSWVEVDGWSQHGAIGDTAALISTSLINRGRDVKQKGTANAGSMANVFAVIDDDPGQIALIAAAAPANKNNYAFRILGNDAPVERSATVTISVASPGVITWTAHDLDVNTPVVFSTTGALPTGLTAGTTYYVRSVLDPDTFTVAATPGGTVINTSSTQSGVHTATTAPTPGERLFAGLVMQAQEQGGEANTIRNLNSTIEVNSNIVKINRIG
jgi:hypothetical protein